MDDIAKRLFEIDKNKFREVAKTRTYEEFIDYLKQQMNFKIINNLSDIDKYELYRLSRITYR